MSFVIIIAVIFYVFTGILIAYLWHELTPLATKSRLILNALVWPALVMLFFGAWAVFSVDSMISQITLSFGSIRQQTFSFPVHKLFSYRVALRDKLRSVR